jgi:hypothetical protein
MKQSGQGCIGDRKNEELSLEWHCVTSRKVAGSILDGVIGIFL